MSQDDQGGAGRREVAYRVFAAEFEDADLSYSESDEERAPNYVVTPTGARVNRLFLVGVLTEVEEAGEDILRARVVDPTGAFVVYAGQYQPEAQAFFDRAEPPAFVAVTGKARTFQPEDSDVTYTSVRPENVNDVTAETRDRWSVGTARQTLNRVATVASALDREKRDDELRRLLEEQGVDVGLAAGIPLAIDHYGTTGAYLDAVRDLSVQVAEVVAGERDEVEPFSTSPNASGPADLAALATLDVPASTGNDGSVGAETVASSGTTGGSDTSGSTSGVATSDSSTDETSTGGTETASTTGSDAAAGGTDTGDDIGDFEPGEFDLDEDEREAIEEEYGTGFQSGTEVEDPGEADIDTPEPNAEDEPPADDVDVDEAVEADDVDVDEAVEADDVDVDEAVMDAMRDNDEGGGAPEDAVVAAVTDRLGVGEEAVTGALQEALMNGQCYEPEDGVYKPI
jgi:RPA family protein